MSQMNPLAMEMIIKIQMTIKTMTTVYQIRSDKLTVMAITMEYMILMGIQLKLEMAILEMMIKMIIKIMLTIPKGILLMLMIV
jgi:hypothetical protein